MATVMIVDDSAYARRVHRAILESAGHRVIEASSGTSALELFGIEHPHVVLLDLSMEDIGGIDVLRTLRELAPNLCVIVVSADVQRSTEQAVLSGGANRFLHKPARADELLAAVTDVCPEQT